MSSRSKLCKKLEKALRVRLKPFFKGQDLPVDPVAELGCSIEFLVTYLENKFSANMSWDNWRYDGWHLDHIYPVSVAVQGSLEDLRRCCHFTNLQPLWAKDNIQKSNKLGKHMKFPDNYCPPARTSKKKRVLPAFSCNIQPVLKPEQVSERLGVSVQTIKNWCREGKLEAFKLPSGHWRIHPDACEKIKRSEQ